MELCPLQINFELILVLEHHIDNSSLNPNPQSKSTLNSYRTTFTPDATALGYQTFF